jgi:hypothetical protein
VTGRNLRAAAAGVALGGFIFALAVPLVLLLLPLGIPGASREVPVLIAGALGAVGMVCAVIAVTGAIRTNSKPRVAEQLFLISTSGYLSAVGLGEILLSGYAPFQVVSAIVTVGFPTLCFLIATILMYMSLNNAADAPATGSA